MHATILLGRPGWLAVTLAAIAAAAFLLWWSYRRSIVQSRVKWTCASLKLVAVSLVAVSLVDPLWSGARPVPGENLLAMLVDNSRSMQVDASRDPRNATTQQPVSRAEQLRRLLNETPSFWQTHLAHDYDVRRFRFDTRLQPANAFADLPFDGTSTQLVASLRQLAERYRGRPLAGVMLFTDGTSADLAQAGDLTGLPPVYPVLLGDMVAARDLAIEKVTVSQTPFEDAPVTVQAEITARGYAGHEIVARIVTAPERVAGVERSEPPAERSNTASTSNAQRAGGSQSLDPSHPAAPSPLAEETQTPRDDVARMTFRFQVRPTAPGLQFYRVEVAPRDNPISTHPEVTLENNRRLVAIDRGSKPHRILYVSGRPNWEFKFLNRAIAEDPQLQLAALIRIARREAKFDFRGRTGESSNPLFRGFKKDADEATESFDEPVLVRLNMQDADELRAGFPREADELFRFDAVIVDDLESAFFTRDQLSLLEQFVSERGGGLLMLGGSDSFQHGDWNNTPVGMMLPVYLDRRAEASAATPAAGDAKYRLDLTRDGWLLPWMRLRRTEAEETERLARMPEFKTFNATDGIKPGAMVLATVSAPPGPPQPALVTQRYGRGTTAALTIGDLWRWPLHRKDENDDLSKAWRQTLRWLVADVPDRVSVRVETHGDHRGGLYPHDGLTADHPGAVTLRVTARDASFRPLDNADVRIVVTPPSGEPVTMAAEPSLSEAGVFTALFVAKEAGGYRVSVTARDGDGKMADVAESGWVSDPAADEFRSVVPDRAGLEKLAKATGGEVVPAGELNAFVKRLATRPAPVVEEFAYPLWHQWWFFAAAVCCLGGEWGLRRWKGLA